MAYEFIHMSEHGSERNETRVEPYTAVWQEFTVLGIGFVAQ